ncbi:RING finger and CHY zinc finger domain-containing protein [Musa troglodytarum]|uniref:RING finger and CHY zinc finger domain-containing protein n=1 Tax=Musa troglodytarum TaxID=320322 RepID=A0A9E7FBI2_9LILI|nr:RING finger and CHY zinc finger domain-containing protein [Musa troglodytarum]
MSRGGIDMNFHVKKFNRSYVRCVALSKRQVHSFGLLHVKFYTNEHYPATNAALLMFQTLHFHLQSVRTSLCPGVQQICINCGVCMGKYFCGTCKLFDDDVSKQQYHCSGCGICRIGGRENFFHCFTCGCCYSIVLKNSHSCVEGAMHHDCPVCFEYLFESTNDISVLPCGHTIHVNCLKEMQQHLQFACPLCSKSVCDMSKVWEILDMEIAATPMPESYHNKKVGWLQFCSTDPCIKCRFESYAMTVERSQRFNSMSLDKNALNANLITLAKLNIRQKER